MSRECDKPRDTSTMKCRNCDDMGHLSRECPKPRDYSKVKCSVCEQSTFCFVCFEDLKTLMQCQWDTRKCAAQWQMAQMPLVIVTRRQKVEVRTILAHPLVMEVKLSVQPVELVIRMIGALPTAVERSTKMVGRLRQPQQVGGEGGKTGC